MKQILIIAGGILSLTIMLAIFLAILIVSVFREEVADIWEDSNQVIQISSVQASNNTFVFNDRGGAVKVSNLSLFRAHSCNTLASKLNKIENALAKGSLSLSSSALEQVFMIKNAFDGSILPTKNIACEKANQVIDDFY
ncbi:hypothetical protein [Proteus myxofaciens]|uniref:Uncharacterized protein n=1 Tax=Proteus myxofaciens ATCC 19692 TaxID=1354337 RepID=A0A198GL50_9GAMM|nr:hypothetical protein [Proteus myxofaciens]OAT37559.1 hypothetical protein M983_0335 [Proteus myxofaciens ATCC 19692]